MVRRAVEQDGARVVVIDSLNGYLNAMPQDNFLTAQLHELLSYLEQQGRHHVHGRRPERHARAQHESPVDASYLADSVVLLRYFEHDGRSRRRSRS